MAEQEDILDMKDCGIEHSRGILTHLFRKILMDRKVNGTVWNNLMRRYLMNPINRVPQNSKDRSSARGNLNKELRRDKMTWKVFIKALRFLQPVRIRFEVHLTWLEHDQFGQPKTEVFGLDLDQTSMDIDMDQYEDDVKDTIDTPPPNLTLTTGDSQRHMNADVSERLRSSARSTAIPSAVEDENDSDGFQGSQDRIQSQLDVVSNLANR